MRLVLYSFTLTPSNNSPKPWGRGGEEEKRKGREARTEWEMAGCEVK